MSMALFSAAALLQSATGNMFDVIDAVDAFLPPHECPHGCMNWTEALNATEQAASFADPSLLPGLGARCAIPGNALHALTQPVAPVMTAMEAAAFYGPICPCRGVRRQWHTVTFVTCVAPMFTPEQINLQLASDYPNHHFVGQNSPILLGISISARCGPSRLLSMLIPMLLMTSSPPYF